MHYSFTGGAFIWFDTKPSDDVRQILRANGFRWHPASGRWWRRKVTGAADVLGALHKALAPKRPDGRPVRPDGTCWRCKDPDGWFRSYGPATPVYCDKCEAESRAARAGGAL